MRILAILLFSTMSDYSPRHSGICFAPSVVRGVANVSTIEVLPDQIVLHRATDNVRLRWESIASKDAPPPKWLAKKPALRVIGELHFDRTDYAKSYIRFFTHPEITIFMPDDGCSTYPDSVFWKFQEVVRTGGFRLIDQSQGERKQEFVDFGPGWARTLRNVTGLVAVLNFAAFMIMCFIIGGSADPNVGADGRYFVRSRGSQTEVSREIWLYSLWHFRAMILTQVFAFVSLGVWYFCRRYSIDLPKQSRFEITE